mmetsp:Transcript_16966/g.29990  ORF Transcript_16966/g.29990 Transcript_16966/m.29990 type:complete len:144 (+) Transcript_16966:719-1150(+)
MAPCVGNCNSGKSLLVLLEQRVQMSLGHVAVPFKETQPSTAKVQQILGSPPQRSNSQSTLRNKLHSLPSRLYHKTVQDRIHEAEMLPSDLLPTQPALAFPPRRCQWLRQITACLQPGPLSVPFAAVAERSELRCGLLVFFFVF